MDRKEKAAWMWFQHVAELRDRDLFRIYQACGSMREAYKQIDKLYPLTTDRQLGALKAARYAGCPEAYQARLEAAGVRYIAFEDRIFPEKLRQIPDPPFGLFLKGTLPDTGRPSAAIVGARACSEYGKAVARAFSQALAERGVQIISGMARGIDSVGQEACLKAGGYSLAVLGNGVDICYPKELKELYDRLQLQGGIASSYSPGVGPMAWNFPPRNRLISGLSDMVLVIEAREKSGTFITVDMALEQGREVYVVPGRITDSLSQGCNRLLSQGAQAILDTDQLIEAVRKNFKRPEFWKKNDFTGHKSEEQIIDINRIPNVDERLKSVYEILEKIPLETEFLFRKWKGTGAQGDFQTFMEILLKLEFMELCTENRNRFYKM